LFSKVKDLLAERSRHFLSFFTRIIALALVFYLSFLSFRLTLDYKNATVLWRQLLSRNPKAFLAYHNLGVYSSDLDESIALFRKAIEIEPSSYPSYLHLGLRYTKIGQYENALRAYQQAIATTPERMVRADCYHRIGEIYLIQNDPRNAISSIEKAISLQKDPFYLKEQRIALEMKRSSISFEASLYQALGAARFLNNNYLESLNAFRQALALEPDNPRNYLGLGAASMKLGDSQNARQALRKAYELTEQPKRDLQTDENI
jgi:Flp pilus assembly protein TadD